MTRESTTRSIGWLLALALVFTSASCQSHFREKKQESLLAADRARTEAMVFADESELYMTLHSGLTYIHSNGKVDSKDSLMDALILGRVDYRRIKPGDRIVEFHGQMGVITGPVHMVVATESEEIELDLIYTAIYWWEGNRWQLATYKSRPADTTAASP